MNPASRVLLTGVPMVHFYDGGEQSPEDVPFPSCLAACLRYLGEDYPWLVKEHDGKVYRDNYAYIYLMAHSGMAFGLRWRDGWHMDNVDNMLAADPNEVIRHTFQAAGYTYELIQKAADDKDEDRFRTCIRKPLEQGRPVLAFGVIGPPECCLVTGFDDSGDVLIGWNFFQSMPPFNEGVGFEPTGQFRKRDWFNDTWSLIIVGEKTSRPVEHLLNREALQWALHVARTPMYGGHHTGHSAYMAWTRQLADEDEFDGKTEAELRERHDAHNNLVGMLAERRWFGAQWLRYIARDEPGMASELVAAADCLEREHDLMWKVWGAAGGHRHPDAWRELARPTVRHQVVEFITEALDNDIRAAEHLEHALMR